MSTRTTRRGAQLVAAFAIAAAMLAGPAAKADIYCAGTFSDLIMYYDGSVMVLSSWRNDWTYICNTQGQWGGIDGASCLAWYAAAVKAAMSQVPVGIWYSGNTYTCANLPTYGSAPAPLYFRTAH